MGISKHNFTSFTICRENVCLCPFLPLNWKAMVRLHVASFTSLCIPLDRICRYVWPTIITPRTDCGGGRSLLLRGGGEGGREGTLPLQAGPGQPEAVPGLSQRPPGGTHRLQQQTGETGPGSAQWVIFVCYIQGDTSGWFKPPVDFDVKVAF